MSEVQLEAKRLAQLDEQYRKSLALATRALVVLECTLNNVAGRHGLPRPTVGLSSVA